MATSHDYDLYSFIITWLYFALYALIFLIHSVLYAKAVKEIGENIGCKKFIKQWLKSFWRKKRVYIALLPHFFDQATDLGVILEYYSLRNESIGIDAWYLFVVSIAVIVCHRIISSIAIYRLTREPQDVLYQLFDLLIIRAVWTNYELQVNRPSNSQRYLQTLEAIFESAPQILISTAFLIKSTNAHTSPIVIVSLATSLWTLSARVSSDDKVMFYSEWQEAKLSKHYPYINHLYVIRVIFWRFLEITSRISLLALVWINLGGISVFILLLVECIFLCIVCYHVGTVDMMGNLIYLVAAVASRNNDACAESMTVCFWTYRVISTWILLICVTVFATTDFDRPFIQSYDDRYTQTFVNAIGLSLFIFTWISTPIWQWIAAVLVFDYENVGSVARDIFQLLDDGNLREVAELIAFGADFDEDTLLEKIAELKKEQHLQQDEADKISTFIQQKTRKINTKKPIDFVSFQIKVKKHTMDENKAPQKQHTKDSTWQHEYNYDDIVKKSVEDEIKAKESETKEDFNIENKKFSIETVEREATPIRDIGLYIIPIIILNAVDFAALIIHSVNDCNKHSYSALEFGAGDWINIGCISHIVVVLSIAICMPLLYYFSPLQYTNILRCVSVTTCFVSLFFLSWSMVGFVFHSENHFNDQCKHIVFAWSVVKTIECTAIHLGVMAIYAMNVYKKEVEWNKIKLYATTVVIIAIFVAFIFGSDFAVLVMGSKKECDHVWRGLHINDWMLTAGIVHMALFIVSFGCWFGIDYWQKNVRRILDEEKIDIGDVIFSVCLIGLYMFVLLWAIIGIVSYSEMMDDIDVNEVNKQCAQTVLAWNITKLIECILVCCMVCIACSGVIGDFDS